MDIISHVQEMLAKGTISSYIALGIAGVCGVLMLLGALAGLRRGITRQTVRFLTIIVSILISFFAATGITNGVLGYFDGKTLEEAITQLAGAEALEGMDGIVLAILNGISPAAVQQILALPFALFLAPIAFMLVFIVVSALMGIVHKIVSGACGFTKRKNNALTRLLGFVLGGLQGIIVTAVILVPISGILGMVGDTVAQVERLEDTAMASTGDEGDDTSDEFDMTAILDIYDEYLRDAVESPVLKLTNTLGGELLSKQISTVKIAGKRQDVRETIPSLVEIAVDAMGLADLDINNLTQDDKDTIKGLVDKVMNQPLTSTIIVEGFRAAAGAVESGAIDLSELEAPLDDIVSAAVSVYADSTVDSVKSDLTTFCEVFFIVADSDIIKNPDDIDPIALIIAPDDENLIIRVLEVIADNTNFNGVILGAFDVLAEAIEEDELELPEEMASFMFAIDPVVAHFAGMESLDGIVADVKTLVAVMRDLDGAGIFDENAEIELDKFLFAEEEGATPLIDTILGRFVENEALDKMFIDIIAGAAEAIKNGDIEEMPEEMDEYLFLITPVLDHFGNMSSVQGIIDDLDTIIEIYVEIDEAGLDEELEDDVMLDLLLFGEDPLVDRILAIVEGNAALSELVVDVLASAANAISDGTLPVFDEVDMPEDVKNIVMEIIGVIGSTENMTQLKGDIQVVKDVFVLVDGIEFDEDTDYIELLFGAEEGEDSVIIAALEILAESRFDDAVLKAIQTFASDPAFLEDADEATVEIIKPFLDVFKGEVAEGEDPMTLADVVADVEAIQDIIILLNDSGAFEENADVAVILFVVAEGEDEALIQTVIGMLESTDFADPLVNAYKSIAMKDEDGDYKILEDADALTASLVGPLLEEIANTSDFTQVKTDVGYICEAITILNTAGILDDSSEMDELEAIFGREGEGDSVLVQVIDVFVDTRFEDELTVALTETIGDELDNLGSDPTMAVITKAMFNLLHEAEDLAAVKTDINALGDVIILLEVSGDADMLALLRKDTAGNTPIGKAIDKFTTEDLQEFLVEVVTGLAEGVVNNYDDDEDEIEIDLGALDESTHAFVVSMMEVLVGIKNDEELATAADKAAQIDADVATMANIIEILEDNGYMTEDGIVNIDVVTLFTGATKDGNGNYVYDAANTAAMDLILAEFENNSHLNPVLLSLAQSLSDDIDLVDVVAPFDMLVASVADVFQAETCTADTIVGDIGAVSDVFKILVEEGVLKDEIDAVEVLTRTKDGKTVVDRIKAALGKENNPSGNTAVIITDFTKISLALIVNSSTNIEDGASNSEEIEETYNDAKVELDTVVTDSVIVTDGDKKYSEMDDTEKEEAVNNVSTAISDALNNTLKPEDSTDEEPVVSDEVAKGMAEFVLENYGDKTMDDLIAEELYVPVTDANGDVVTDTETGETVYEISDEAVSDVILSYYQAWLAAQQNGGAGN